MLSYTQKTFKHLSGRASAVFGFVSSHPFVSIALVIALVYGLVKKAGASGSESRLDGYAKAD
jgi:hypothetical protein